MDFLGHDVVSNVLLLFVFGLIFVLFIVVVVVVWSFVYVIKAVNESLNKSHFV